MNLVTLVIVCVVLTLWNLLLTFGVIRRLRLHSDQITELDRATPRPEPMIAVGSRPQAFTATTVDGEVVTNERLSAGGLVAFFSPTCASCEEWIPRFVATTSTLPGGRGQALAVVVADGDTAASDMVAKLRDVAMVVVEAEKGPLADAFAVIGYPSMCRLDDGGVVVDNRLTDVVVAPVAA